MNRGAAVFATEWGTPSADGGGTVNEAQSQAWLDFMKAHNVSWCNWSLVDKAETASALTPGASPTGPWPDGILTESGRLVKQALAQP
jgi:endoglucanase